MKSVDNAKLKRYYSKWTQAKYLFGCALLVDHLTPCSIFYKCMQSDEVDILGSVTRLLKSFKDMNKHVSKPRDKWPTYVSTLLRGDKRRTYSVPLLLFQIQ